jgi:hypothetical protein
MLSTNQSNLLCRALYCHIIVLIRSVANQVHHELSSFKKSSSKAPKTIFFIYVPVVQYMVLVSVVASILIHFIHHLYIYYFHYCYCCPIPLTYTIDLYIFISLSITILIQIMCILSCTYDVCVLLSPLLSFPSHSPLSSVLFWLI